MKSTSKMLKGFLGGGLVLLAVFALVGHAAAQVSVTPPPGLVSWWPGDGTTTDIVGTNNGTLVNGATFAAGEVGQAFSLNGTSQFVEIPNNPGLNPSTEITVDAWIFVTANTFFPNIVSKGNVGNFAESYALFLFTGGTPNGQPAFLVNTNGTSTGRAIAVASSTVPLNTWTHVAGTYDGVNVKVYVNGVLAGTTPHTGTIFATPDPVLIGKANRTPSSFPDSFFSGLIDEVEVFNRALSAAEVASIFAAGSAGKRKGAPFINAPVAFPGGAVGVAYSQPLIAAMGTQPYSFALTSGALPPGLSLSTTGVVSGTPTTTGTSTFTVQVTDSLGQSSQRTYSISVFTCLPPPSALVSWWPGEGNANDIRGGNNGTLVGGVTFAPGKVAQAFMFDGVSGDVQVQSDPSLNIGTQWFVDLWINPGAYPPAGVAPLLNKWVSGLEDKLIMLNSTGNIGVLLFVGGTTYVTSPPLFFSTSALPLNTWSFVAVTYNGSAVKIYINGVLGASAPATGSVANSNGKLYFGHNPDRLELPGFFKGLLDEIEWATTVPTDAQIQAIFAAGSAGKCTGIPPGALCRNVTVNTTPGLCTAPASVNNNSFDPSGGAITLAQSPAGPYSKGTTNVTLTVIGSGASSSCNGTVTVVDNQPPAITCPLPPVVECTGPTGAPASFTPTVSDNCPGTIATICTRNSGSTFPLGSTPVSCTATDQPGNASSCGFSVTVRDTTAPAITITTPTSTSYTLNQAVPAGYACTDICSGVATCAGPVPSGSSINTASVGSKSFTVTATDNAANSASRTVNYTVVYTFSGFQAPLSAGSFGGVFKLGRTLPIKWQLTDATGAFIGTAVATTTLRVDSVLCTGQGDGTPPFDPGTSGSSGLRYDSTANQYIFNWQTTGLAAGCYNIILDPGDGVQRVTLVQLAP